MAKGDLTENEKRDYDKYYVKKLTTSSEYLYNRNQAVIDGTIKKYEAKRREKLKQYHEALGERIDAAADFAIRLSKMRGAPGSQDAALAYFGKKELARLQGQKIMKRIFGDQIILEEAY